MQKMASFAMTAKKSHEVERFSQFVKEFVLEKSDRINQVNSQLSMVCIRGRKICVKVHNLIITEIMLDELCMLKLLSSNQRNAHPVRVY